MSGRSIKSKVIILTVAVLALGGAGIMGLIQRSYQVTLQRVTAEALATSRSTFNGLVAEEIRTVSSAMELLMENPVLREPYARRDRAQLLTVSTPVYAGLKTRYGITNLNYLDENVLRILVMSDPANPKFMGTKTVRFNVQESERTKTWCSGLGMGGNGFAVRVTHPVYDQGLLAGSKLIGYLEMGTEVNGFLGSMKKQTGNDYAMVILKKNLKADEWAMTRKLLGQPNNWEDRSETVMAVNTTGDEATFAAVPPIESLAQGGRVLDVVRKAGRAYARSVFPVRDVSGAQVGAIVVLNDVTGIVTAMAHMRLLSLAGVLVLMVILSTALVVGLRVLVFARLEATQGAITNLVGGDFETRIVPVADDEVGRIEQMLEQFRVVFVNTIKDLQG